MSLDYDFSKTNIPTDDLNQTYKNQWGGDGEYTDLKPQYKAMVFITMAVAVGYIRNEKEAEEMWQRIRFYETNFSPIMRYWNDKPVTEVVTLDGVEREFIYLKGVFGSERRTFKCGFGFHFPVDDVFEGRMPELEKEDDHVSYYFETVDELKDILGKSQDFLGDYMVFDIDWKHRDGDSVIDRDLVYECIGMRTNVTTKTRTAWLKNIMNQRELFPVADAFKAVK